jgi:hypothetical protein
MEGRPPREPGVANLHRSIARCLMAMIDYHETRANRGFADRLVDEICAVASDLARSGLLSDESARRIVRPVERELKARYGRELGNWLYIDFIRVFDGCEVVRELAGP